MRKLGDWKYGIGIAAFICIAASAGAALAQDLVVSGVGGAAQAAAKATMVDPFAKMKGITIVEDEYDQKIAELRAQIESGHLKWDVVMVGPSVGPLACDEGLLENLSADGVVSQADFTKPLSPCLVPMFSSSGVLVYDGKRFGDNGPKTWADFWDVKKFPGKRGFYNAPNETLEPALLADGVSPQDLTKVLTSPEGVDRAFRKLDQLKPNIHWWNSASDALQLLSSGELAMTYCWNGRVTKANRDDKLDLRIVWDAGHINGSEFYAIVKGTKHRAEAIEFLKFASAPQQQAAFAKITPYAPLNNKATGLLDSSLVKVLPSTYMQYAVDQDDPTYVNFWLNNMDSLNERFLTWQSQ
jgi:putative spermidine/putrescine transport system substrate-binding protein